MERDTLTLSASREGDDHLSGNEGNDTPDGGLGKDVLEGGIDSDTFIVYGGDTIKDSDPEDRVFHKGRPSRERKKTRTGIMWESKGETYFEEGLDLRIERSDGSVITIENWEEDDAGIELSPGPPNDTSGFGAPLVLDLGRLNDGRGVLCVR